MDKSDKLDKFTEAFASVTGDDGFKKLASNHKIDELDQKYIITLAIGNSWSEQDRCDVLDIKYNFRPHRRCKVNRDQSPQQGLLILTKRLLTSGSVDPSLVPVLPMFDDSESLESVLKRIIYSDAKATDQVKAIESLVRLEEKTQNSKNLKPWERIWCDVIIPKLLHTNTLQ
jgi:hypothetical protein